MLTYLQKFNNLEHEVREKVSSPQTMAALETLEKKYNVNLASVVMRVMVRDISILDLSKFFVFEYGLEARAAEELVEEMKEKVFHEASSYLGFYPRKDEPEENGQDDLSDWMDKQKQSAQIRTSDFFFSPEDEEEVKALAKKLDDFKKEKKEKEQAEVEDANKIVEEIIARINIKFSSDEILGRLGQILMTFVKGVRNRVDTKDTLMKDVESGGLDLNDDLSSRILSISEKVKEEFKNRPSEKKKDKENTAKKSGKSLGADEKIRSKKEAVDSLDLRDLDYDFESLKKRGREKSADNPEEPPKSGETKKTVSFDEINALAEKSLSSREKGKTAKNQIPRISEKAKLEKPETPRPARPPSTAAKTKTSSGGKVKMQDVKYVPKLTGPVDELKEMNFVDFRRLGAGPLDSAKKIIEKIEFLERDSYKKRLSGIKAWRESPVNKEYLRIGKESINKNISIKDIIAGNLEQNSQAMTIDEFSAIMELNKKLRF